MVERVSNWGDGIGIAVGTVDVGSAAGAGRDGSVTSVHKDGSVVDGDGGA